MSYDSPQIPEASEPDTFVRGRLVPPTLAKDVRRGWQFGVAFASMLVLGIAVKLYFGYLSTTDLLFDVTLLSLAIYGVHAVRGWSRNGSVLLFCLPIISTLYVAYQVAGMVPSYSSSGTVRIVFLVAFLYTFGKAAIAINRFEKSVRSEA